MSRNAVPIAGILFLGWHAPSLIVLYFIDFIADFSLCLALLMLLDPEFRTLMEIGPGARGRAKLVGVMLLVIGFLAAAFGFVFGMPVFGMFMMDADLSLGALFADPRFLRALAVHLALCSWTYVQAYRYFAKLRESDATFDVSVPVKGRFRYVLGRWLAVYATALFVPFLPVLMPIAYCIATIYIEMFPERLQRFFDGDDVKSGPSGT
ncbi:MAG: hypothetical protein ACXWG1_14900 [Usitatibacter sp.]